METIRISDELVVDMAPGGTIYGVELLNANERLRREDTRRLLVINEAPVSVPNCRLLLADETEGCHGDFLNEYETPYLTVSTT